MDGLIQMILDSDRESFLFLNGLHCRWLDPVMFYASWFIVWIPLFLFLGYLVWKGFGKKTFIIVPAIAILITVTDQSANLAKNNVKRLRPAFEPVLAEKVHTVNNYRGGLYSFYSGHAANTFAVAVFFSLLLRRRYRWIPALLFTWAAVMSYTRIYLGVHYPLDILAGAFAGGITGWLFALLVRPFISE